MFHGALIAIANCVRYISGHFHDGTCKSANVFLAQTPPATVSDFGKRPHDFVGSLLLGPTLFQIEARSYGVTQLGPTGGVWSNACQVSFTLIQLRLPHQLIELNNVD